MRPFRSRSATVLLRPGRAGRSSPGRDSRSAPREQACSPFAAEGFSSMPGGQRHARVLTSASASWPSVRVPCCGDFHVGVESGGGARRARAFLGPCLLLAAVRAAVDRGFERQRRAAFQAFQRFAEAVLEGVFAFEAVARPGFACPSSSESGPLQEVGSVRNGMVERGLGAWQVLSCAVRRRL